MIRAEDGSMFLKVGPKGCTTSDVWDDGFGGQVTQIFIWHAEVIYGIQAVYQRDGITVVGKMHGSDEGDFNAVCLDGPLTRVRGYYDEDDYDLKLINSLKFETNTSSYGPFGVPGIGEAFSFATETGICGFHGRCSKILAGIAAFGVYVNVTTGIVGQASPRSSTGRC